MQSAIPDTGHCIVAAIVRVDTIFQIADRHGMIHINIANGQSLYGQSLNNRGNGEIVRNHLRVQGSIAQRGDLSHDDGCAGQRLVDL